jgi:hypothetical protein
MCIGCGRCAGGAYRPRGAGGPARRPAAHRVAGKRQPCVHDGPCGAGVCRQRHALTALWITFCGRPVVKLLMMDVWMPRVDLQLKLKIQRQTDLPLHKSTNHNVSTVLLGDAQCCKDLSDATKPGGSLCHQRAAAFYNQVGAPAADCCSCSAGEFLPARSFEQADVAITATPMAANGSATSSTPSPWTACTRAAPGRPPCSRPHETRTSCPCTPRAAKEASGALLANNAGKTCSKEG